RPRERMGAARGRLRGLHRHRGRLDEDAQLGRVGHRHPPEGPERLPAALPDQRDADSAPARPGTVTLPEHRADAFARLFEAVHEGVYIGLLGPQGTATLAVNPHLKSMFGYSPDEPDRQIRPFEAARFLDPQARTAFVGRLAAEG